MLQAPLHVPLQNMEIHIVQNLNANMCLRTPIQKLRHAAKRRLTEIETRLQIELQQVHALQAGHHMMLSSALRCTQQSVLSCAQCTVPGSTCPAVCTYAAGWASTPGRPAQTAAPRRPRAGRRR